MKRENRMARLVAILIFYLVTVAVMLVQTQSQTGMADLGSVSVAIFRFVNVSAAPEDEWIGAGIAETVAAEFERIEGLSVIRRDADEEAIFELSSDRGDEDFSLVARQRSQQLGSEWFVVGGYQRFTDRLRIIARVINADTGRTGRVVKVDGAAAEIFQLQDQVVAELQNGFMHAIRGRSEITTDRAPETPSRVVDRRTLGREPSTVDNNRPPSSVNAIRGSARGNPEKGDAGVGLIPVARSLAERPAIKIPRTDQPPNIDGTLDDVVWDSAVHLTEFVQQQPLEGAPATEATDIYIAYDSDNIYLAVHAHYSDPNLMRANRVDRDQAFSDDKVRIYFDPFLDQQRAYSFSVNGYGVQGDAIIDASGRGGGGGRGRGGGHGGGFSRRGIPYGDNSWDALFDSGAEIVADGFTAELAIPFKSLRYPQRERGNVHQWGFQIVREIRGKDENVVWAPISRGVSGFLTQMGLLDGMTNLSTSRNLEIMPVLTGIQFGSINSSSGDFVAKDPEPEGGVNVKYGITSNLTADFTYNPDFSQIESDRPQIETNQRFSLFYPELRPFFLEGAEIFNVSGPINYVHTRTIVDPDWGGKITGKVGNITIGFLAANDTAVGDLDSSLATGFGDSANVVIGRARYDLYSESHIGGMVTNREFLDSHSRMMMADGSFRLGQTQNIGFVAVQTDHRDLDGAGSVGEMFDMNYRLNGRHWNVFTGAYRLSPDFKTDVGFVRRVDEQRIVSTIGYRFWPETTVTNWGPSVTYVRNWSYADVLEDENLSVSLNTTFRNNISANVSVGQDMERFQGIKFDKSSVRFFGRVSTSRKFSIGGFFRYGDEVRYIENPFLGRGGGGGLFATVRPVSRFQSQINLNTSRLIDPRNDDELVFDVKIVRALSTYQFTDRLALRTITEYNTLQESLGLNLLASYRVNAGTVFYVGLDDRFRQADRILGEDIDGDGLSDYLFPSITTLQRTNRAFFTKLQYLFRY